MSKKFLNIFLALMLVLSSALTSFANQEYNNIEDNFINEEYSNIEDTYISEENTYIDEENNDTSDILVLEDGETFLPEITNYEEFNPNIRRIANAIPMTVKAKPDGSGCKVYVGNIGVDNLDLVTVTVKTTGYSNPSKKTATVIPIAGKTFDFNIPMIKSNTTYSVTVKIQDGGKVKTKSGEAKLSYTDEKLKGVWHKGTYSSRGHSLEDHFKRHGREVSSTNIISYINKAINYRSEVIKSLKNIRTSRGTGSIPSTKYKNTVDGRFIILSDSGKEIFTFGK